MRPAFWILFSLMFCLPGFAATVILPEDEVILPPLLNRVRSDLGGALDGVNVKRANSRARRAVIGEWFDYGDTLDLPATTSFEVVQNEDLAWVGGGGFSGTVGNYAKTEASLPQYSIAMNRGWIRVWIQPGKFDSLVRIEGNGDSFTAKDAEFWLNIRTGASDLYVIRGEVTSQSAGQTFDAGLYVSLFPGRKPPRVRSRSWTPEAMEVPIAGSYPAFVRLSVEASRDWARGKTSRLFADLRKKGWRKFFRLTPEVQKK